MAEKLLDQTLKIQPIDVFKGLWRAWLNLFQTQPNKNAILCLMAQSALETGRWKSIHCFNFGNIKSSLSDGRDYTFFACNEYFELERAKKYAAESALAKITNIRSDGLAVIWFYPDHPVSRFRAYKTLDEGASDYMLLLYTRYKRAWTSVLNGDPVGFSKALKQQGYYTADEIPYTKGLKSLFDEFSKLHINEEDLPILSDEQARRLNALVAMSLAEIDLSECKPAENDEK